MFLGEFQLKRYEFRTTNTNVWTQQLNWKNEVIEMKINLELNESN